MNLKKLIKFSCLAIFFFSVVSQAQTAATGASVEELQRQLDEMRKQMGAMQSKIDALESSKENAPATPSAVVAPSAQEGAIQTVKPLPPGPISDQVGQQTRSYQTFSEDPFAAARLNNVPLDPKYHGYFVLPGTNTMLKIGGYFKTDFIYDLKPAGNTDEFIPATIPIPGPTGVNNTTISIRPTRLSLDFRVPTSKVGDARFYLEGDIFGTNATTPRLRHAYGQVKNFLIGQTFSNFMNPDASPDTLDFEGPNGLVNIRNPQFRYGFALSKSTTFTISLEKPSSDVSFTTANFSSQ